MILWKNECKKPVGSKNVSYLDFWVKEIGEQGTTANSPEVEQQKAWHEAKTIKHM